MISIFQIDAALGLLGKKRSQAAEQLGIKVATFNSYFSGTEMKSDRNVQIQRWLENQGIVFTEDDGVKRSKEKIRVYRGQEGFQEFMTDVYETCRDVGGDVYVTNVNEDLFDKWMGEDFVEEFYMPNMHALPDGRFKFHTIISEDDTYKPSNTYSEYRRIPKKYFSDAPTYIYGDKAADIVFLEDDVIVRVFERKERVEKEKKIFRFMWDNATSD